MATPTPEVVKKAIDQMKKSVANHQYFFSKLESPDWLSPLRDAGLFKHPPAATREGSRISFLPWPESQYLARVAKQAPAEVFDIVNQFPDTDNASIHSDLVDIALSLPPSTSNRVAKRELTWLAQQDHLYLLLPEKFADLVVYLAENRQSKTAVSITKALFRIRRDETNRSSAGSILSEYEFEQLLKKLVPTLAQVTDFDLVNFLAGLLEKAAQYEERSILDRLDSSSWWRRAIEDHPQNYGGDNLSDILTTSLRDAAVFLIESKGRPAAQIVSPLLSRQKSLLLRIALYVLGRCHNHALRLASKAVLTRKYFDARDAFHEYTGLLKVVFPKLSKDEASRFLHWVEEGPKFPKRLRAHNRKLRQQEVETWQRDWLANLDGQLPKRWQKKYSKLIETHGDVPHVGFRTWSESWVGPTSPKSEVELSKMSVVEIADYLDTWNPPAGWAQPTREGLGRLLESVVKTRPTEFIDKLSLFRKSEPTYPRAVVQGISANPEAIPQLSWVDVLNFAKWIVDQPRSIPSRQPLPGLQEDPDWGWARKAVARLIQTTLQKRLPPLEARKAIWEILLVLSVDPDPAEGESAFSDPISEAINSTRGETFHGIILYAWWIYQNLKDAQEPRPDFSQMPEVRDLLEQHLQISKEPSPAIRAVYGQRFPLLATIDAEWTRSMLPRIFPWETPDKRFAEAAWGAYILFSPIYGNVFAILEPQYRRAVDRLNTEKQFTSMGDLDEGLGRHLVPLIGWGKVGLGVPNGILDEFISKARPDQLAALVKSAGFDLYHAKNAIDPDALRRYQAFWDARVEILQRDPKLHNKALQEFGWWFAARAFPFMWRANNLRRALTAANGIDVDFLVVETLAIDVETHPGESVALLLELERVDDRRWHFISSAGGVQTILKRGLEFPESRGVAIQIINNFGARGHHQFRDLLHA